MLLLDLLEAHVREEVLARGVQKIAGFDLNEIQAESALSVGHHLGRQVQRSDVLGREQVGGGEEVLSVLAFDERGVFAGRDGLVF